MNCHTFSTGLSSGHLGGSAMMVMLAGNDQACRHVPAGLVDQEDSVGGGCNGRGDLRKVQVHRFGIAGRQDQGCALAPLRAYRTEDIGGGGPLVTRCAWAGAALRPATSGLVLLADACLVGELSCRSRAPWRTRFPPGARGSFFK